MRALIIVAFVALFASLASAQQNTVWAGRYPGTNAPGPGYTNVIVSTRMLSGPARVVALRIVWPGSINGAMSIMTYLSGQTVQQYSNVLYSVGNICYNPTELWLDPKTLDTIVITTQSGQPTPTVVADFTR